VQLGDPLADRGIAQRIGVLRLHGLEQGAQVLGHRDGLARAPDAFLAERAHRDEPAVSLVAEPIAHRDLDIVEEDLAEQRVARDLTNRADVDARQPPCRR